MLKKLINFFFILLFQIALINFLFAEPTYSKNSEDSPNLVIHKIEKSRLLEFEELNSYKNDLFKDYCKIVEENFKLSAQGKNQEILFFKYTPKINETLISIASRCCINYDTIATLNNLKSSTQTITGKTILLPTVQGLFISRKNNNAINSMIIEKYANEILTNANNYYRINNEDFIFLPGLRFDGTIRNYFLDSSLSLPLKKDSYWISSEFGLRKNPFTSDWKNHNGIDLAAEEGTPVYAIKDGIVSLCIKNDPTFGNYIILSHDDGLMTSVYAHLKESLVKNKAIVKKGDIIGYVGKTGKVTGPHLHFEIRQNGKVQNPEKVLSL